VNAELHDHPDFGTTSIPVEKRRVDQTVATNLDHTFDAGLVERLRCEDIVAQYSAWNFCGYVWHEADGFWCEVWVHHEPKAVVKAEGLEDLMDLVSAEFGAE
jgi:hypothetical protein